MTLEIYKDLWQQILCFSQICRFLPTKIKVLSLEADADSLDARGSPGRGYRSVKPANSVSAAMLALYMKTTTDQLLMACDTALRTLFAQPHASKPCPTLPGQTTDLTAAEQALSASLMRVNHVGEVCAQALYTAQALATPNAGLRAHYQKACQEETDHLAWTAQRLEELGARPSLLNPLWYAGAFGLGLLAGRLGDAVSLGFVVETETQVGAHLDSHLQRLPPHDHASRAIVAQMRDDEIGHARQASVAGAAQLPSFVGGMMRAAAKVMTTVAHRV
jgi:ubiquinone biosynthesis monooxygenase Coq7